MSAHAGTAASLTRVPVQGFLSALTVGRLKGRGKDQLASLQPAVQGSGFRV